MWTDPAGHVFTTGEIVTAATMNTYIKDNLLYLFTPPAFRAYHSANETPVSATWSPLFFNSERYDATAMHSTVTNTNRGTVAVAGRYLIAGSIQWDASAVGVRRLGTRINGTTYVDVVWAPNNGAGGVEQSIATEYALAVTDYAELMIWQDSGGGLDVLATANYSPEFSMSFQGGT